MSGRTWESEVKRNSNYYKIVRAENDVQMDNEGPPQWLSIKNLPVMQETQETRVRPPGWKDPLEEEMTNRLQ